MYRSCFLSLRINIVGRFIYADMKSKINAFATSCYRIMLDIKRKDCVSNTIIYTITNTEPLVHCVASARFSGVFIFFVFQRNNLPEGMFYVPSHGKRKPGRPRTSYLAYIQRLFGYNEDELLADQTVTLAIDRYAWRKLVIACSAVEGWSWILMWRLLSFGVPKITAVRHV